MKIRHGFVSNSSSSSFIILGFRIDDIFGELRQYAKDNDIDCFDKDDNMELCDFVESFDEEIDYEYLNGNTILGYNLVSFEDDYIEDTFVKLDTILNHPVIKKLMKITGKSFSDLEIIGGTHES